MDTRTSPAKRVAINTSFLYAKMGITVFVSLYSTRLILNALGVSDFGIFSVVGGAIAMLTFLNNAMTGASQRYMSYAEGEGNKQKQKNIFNVSLVLHAITGILVVFLLEAVGYFLFDGILSIPADRIKAAQIIYQFMIVSTFFTILSVPFDAVINAHEDMLFVAIIGVVESFFKLFIALYITKYHSDRLIMYGLLIALLTIVLVFVRQIFCRFSYEEVRINISRYFDKPLFRNMTAFAGWNLLGASSSMLSYYGQGIVLNAFFGTLANAAHGVAVQINGQLSAFANTMMKALNPIIVKSEGAGNRNFMLKASMAGSRISFFLLSIFFIPFLIETPYILKIWLKNIPEYAIVFSQLTLIKTLIDQLYTPLSSSIMAVGRIKKYKIFTSVLHFSTILLSIVFFSLNFQPHWNYISFIINGILMLIVTVWAAKKLCGLSISFFFKSVVLKCLLIFVITFTISLIPVFFMEEGFYRLLLILLLSSLVLIITTYLFGLNFLEKQRVNNFINKKIKNKHAT